MASAPFRSNLGLVVIGIFLKSGTALNNCCRQQNRISSPNCPFIRFGSLLVRKRFLAFLTIFSEMRPRLSPSPDRLEKKSSCSAFENTQSTTVSTSSSTKSSLRSIKSVEATERPKWLPLGMISNSCSITCRFWKRLEQSKCRGNSLCR